MSTHTYRFYCHLCDWNEERSPLTLVFRRGHTLSLVTLNPPISHQQMLRLHLRTRSHSVFVSALMLPEGLHASYRKIGDWLDPERGDPVSTSAAWERRPWPQALEVKGFPSKRDNPEEGERRVSFLLELEVQGNRCQGMTGGPEIPHKTPLCGVCGGLPCRYKNKSLSPLSLDRYFFSSWGESWLTHRDL